MRNLRDQHYSVVIRAKTEGREDKIHVFSATSADHAKELICAFSAGGDGATATIELERRYNYRGVHVVESWATERVPGVPGSWRWAMLP